MSLETSYEVLEMLRDDGVQTFRAREKATGRGLELHLFPPFGRPENKILFDKLKALPLEARKKFLDTGLDGSTPYVVTDPLPGGRGFKVWAEDLMGGAGLAAPPPPARDDGVQILQAGQWRTGTPIPASLVTKQAAPKQPPVPTPHAGDLTSVFVAPTFPPPVVPAPPATAPPAPSPLADTKPGEFTGFFLGADGSQPARLESTPLESTSRDMGEFTGLFMTRPAAAAPLPSPPAAPPEPQPATMGEFTRMLQSTPVAPPVVSKAPEPAGGGGEFTKFFENPMSPAAMGASRSPIEVPPPPPPTAKRSGDFTNVFGTPSSGPGSSSAPGALPVDIPPPAPPPPTGPVFGAEPSATGAFSAAPAWSHQPQSQPQFPAGPSEYTKMMGAPALSGVPAPSIFQPSAAPQPSAIPPASPMQATIAKKSNLPIYIGIGAVAVIVIAIVIFLLMQHPAATSPAAR